MGLFAGPRQKCCDAMDYVVVATKERYLAVCITCSRVFRDDSACDLTPERVRRPERLRAE
jgi:hypothetical protein